MTTNNSSGLVHIDRRTTMKWFMGAMAMGQLAACGDQAKGVTWQEMAVIQAKGVGTDIDFNNTAVPWPLTMTPAELVAVNALVDLILPGEGGEEGERGREGERGKNQGSRLPQPSPERRSTPPPLSTATVPTRWTRLRQRCNPATHRPPPCCRATARTARSVSRNASMRCSRRTNTRPISAAT